MEKLLALNNLILKHDIMFDKPKKFNTKKQIETIYQLL